MFRLTYLEKRNRINIENLNKVRNIEKVLILFSVMFFIYGFFDYLFYQMNMRGSTFNTKLFLLGTTECGYKRT